MVDPESPLEGQTGFVVAGLPGSFTGAPFFALDAMPDTRVRLVLLGVVGPEAGGAVVPQRRRLIPAEAVRDGAYQVFKRLSGGR